MGRVTEPQPVKLFVGVLAAAAEFLPAVRGRLEAELGPVDLASPLWDFAFTRYYEAEMGPTLKRQFWGFEFLVEPGRLPEIKHFTNAVEDEFALEGRRRVNLDPGYLTSARLVLATTKDFSHRVYLGRGIYGEVTLMYRRGQFVSLPWTYPDYRTPEYHRFFAELRALYRSQLEACGAKGTRKR
ncbi:MAG: DUF4416 family protein [Clostridia bacterium]|nr:DUF4416 family protein [Clostridia bacterium]